jgi:hypothetical protein
MPSKAKTLWNGPERLGGPNIDQQQIFFCMIENLAKAIKNTLDGALVFLAE